MKGLAGKWGLVFESREIRPPKGSATEEKSRLLRYTQLGEAARKHGVGKMIFSASGGTYYARVAGQNLGEYSLLVTRGAGFDLEATTAQPLGPAGQVLGSLDAPTRVAVHSGSYGGEVVAQLSDGSFFDFDAVAVK